MPTAKPLPSSGIGALALQTPVYERPNPEARVLGYLRAGAIVEVNPQPVGTGECPGGWYSVVPAGYVCAAANNATTKLDDDTLKMLSRRPDFTSPLPYLYGVARHPGPIFGKLPTREQAEAAEPGLDARMKTWINTEGENGSQFRASYWLRGTPAPTQTELLSLWDQKATQDVPSFLQDGKRPAVEFTLAPRETGAVVVGQMKRHNGFAILDTMMFEGRRYALTTRMVIIPVDRIRPITGSEFHGVEIPKDIELPIAFIRVEGASAYKLEGGKFVKDHEVPRRSVIKLTGKQKLVGQRTYYEGADGLWVHDGYASRLDPAKRMPRWGKKGERWLDVNITKQTLVAYDGKNPVYATLVSTGEAGLGDPEKSKSTKRGIFRIHTKHVAATMDSDTVGEEFELQDIPYVQYFEDGYALHTAYWHDDFGRPRSHGCINLSPQDARWLFFFTDPKLPEGWHSVRKSLTGSVVFVHQ